MAGSGSFISFAEGRFGEGRIKFDLVADEPEWCAIAKPAGVIAVADPWYPGEADLVSALRREVRDDKPQLLALGMLSPMAVNRLDRDESGIVLLAKTEEAGAQLRNLSGSGGLKLTYQLLAEAPSGETALTCDLPLARHKQANRMLVSSQTGKKTVTHFRQVEDFGRLQLWEAQTDYARMHQVRVHAAECGLGIVGESVYNAVPHIFLSQLKRGFRRSERPERPIYAHLALHLSRIDVCLAEDMTVRVEAPLPKGFEVLIRRIREFGGR
ncbi:MAG: pseudouridine synthase [Opitutaceae bacterium]